MASQNAAGKESDNPSAVSRIQDQSYGRLSIYKLAARCSSLFEEILSKVQSDCFDLVETQFGRLNIWASNIGVFANENASLDYRLRYSNDIRVTILQLLEVLDRNLSRVISVQTDKDCVTQGLNNPSYGDSSQSFAEAIEAASASIDRLQTLAIVIRKSSAQRRNLRAMTFVSEDDDENFELFALSILRYRFKEANGTLCEQLAASLAMRRKRFVYKSRHQTKLTYNALVSMKDLRATYANHQPTRPNQPPEQIQSLNSPQLHISAIRKAFPVGLPPSQTNATTLDSKVFRKILLDYKPPPSIASKGTSIRDAKLDYPPPPATNHRQSECTCPYCCELLPTAKVKDDRWWRHHVDADLEPYVCISEKCKTVPVQFLRFEDWARHMAEHGASDKAWNVHLLMWNCPICNSIELFRWKQEFMGHMKSCHAERFTQPQLLALTRRSTIAVPREPYICPLCNCMPEEIEQITPPNREKLTDLLPRHIARHLKSLAFMSLPYRDDITDGLSQVSRDPSRGVRALLDDVEEGSAVDSDLARLPLSFSNEDSNKEEEFSGAMIPWKVEGEYMGAKSSYNQGIEIIWDFLPIKPYNSEEDPIMQRFIAVQREREAGQSDSITTNNYTIMAHEDYTVGWICALPLEATAAKMMLEKAHPKLSQPAADGNTYTLGEIAGHNIVIAYLPIGAWAYGTTSIVTVAAQVQSTFPSVCSWLTVGIGSGVPSTKNDIRLGDIVVGKPTGVLGGIVQYDYGKTVASSMFQETGMISQPPQVLLNAVTQLQTDKIIGNNQKISQTISDVLNRHREMESQYSRPVQEPDHLYAATYNHPTNEDNCIKCDKGRLIYRKIRDSDEPQVHYGLIASLNEVIKTGQTRDQLAKKHGIMCFEMEAAGLRNQLPCLVIRGICDYCDSHKNKQWQGYAAITTAAYAKILLSVVPVNQFQKDQILHKACWMVPFERNMQFIGRQDEILKLEKIILNKDQTQKAAIVGLEGVGKTHIALELAYRIRDKNPNYSIFWITSTSMEAIEQAFTNMSEQLGLQKATPIDMKLQIKACLSSETAGSWLLIIDNADDMDIWSSFDSSYPTLKTFLPQSQHGFTLFVTRNRQLAIELVGPNIIHVSEMDDIMAKDLLKASLVQKELLEDNNSATMLIYQLSGLPLALIQAANYINKNLISLNTYLSLLNEYEIGTVDLPSQDYRDDWIYEESKNPVAITWLISFYHIQQLNSLAADYLLFMSCIDPRDIPQSLLPLADSLSKQQSSLELLNAYAFITRQADNQFISLHQLVHIVIRNWLRSEGMLEHWTLKVGQHLRKVFPSYAHENRILWREYMPHAQFILQSNEFQGGTEDREQLAQSVGQCLYGDGRYNEAEILFQEVLEEKSKRLEKGDTEMLISMAWIAATYRNQGRWAEAEKLGVQVMETSNIVLGPEHPDTLTSMANLASTYWDQGRWMEAEKLEVQVLETSEIVLGPEHPDTLTSMANLASTYRSQGRWAEAEKLDVQVMETSKIVLGPEHPGTLASMANLASTYWTQGRLIEAEKLDIQVMETGKAILGPEHPDMLTSMANLASTYRSQGRWTEAEKLGVQVVETRKAILGPEHPDTLNSMGNLALTYWNQGQWTEGEKLDVQVMKTRKTILGPEHPDTLTSMANLALMYCDQGRWTEAEKLGVQVMETSKIVLGPEHPDTLTSMWNLSHTWKRQGQYTKPLELLSNCVRLQRRILGPSHPHTISAATDLEDWRAQPKNRKRGVVTRLFRGK